MHLRALGLCLVLGSLTFACSDALSDIHPLGTQDGRCDLRPKKDQCTDWRDFSGPSMATMQGTCSSLTSAQGGGSWTEGARCDASGMWGGCQTKSADGTLQTNWLYKGDKYKTVDDAKAECDDATWVDPS
jgi:hypothetical protein